MRIGEGYGTSDTIAAGGQCDSAGEQHFRYCENDYQQWNYSVCIGKGLGTKMNKIKNYISKNLVVIFFAVLCILAYLIAGQAPYVVASDLINRVMRNSIMVLALIIPIMTGMGLNFGIVVGAMSAQADMLLIN